MTIADVHLSALRVPRIYKTRVAPAGGHGPGKEDSQYILVELRSNDGFCGLGEISDIESSWNTPSIEVLSHLFHQLLVGTKLVDRHQTVEHVNNQLPDNLHPELHRLIVSAIDIALLDLTARSHNVPVYELLGGQRRSHLTVSWVAFIRSRDLLQEEIEQKITEGFCTFKLKVGENFDEDCEKVRLCRRLIGPGGYIKVDASGQWEESEAADKIPQLAELGADAVETPLSLVSRNIAKNTPHIVNEDPDTPAIALSKLRQGAPVAIIEHVSDFDDSFATALVRHKSVDIFNIVPVQTGSLSRCQRLAHMAEVAGMSVLLGSTIELGPATATGIHLGVTLSKTPLASDLVGPIMLKTDVVDPKLDYDQGRLSPPPGPGLGLRLNREAMRQYACQT